MADLAPLYLALKNADAAGDVASAAKLAAYIKSMPWQASEVVTAQPVVESPSFGDKAIQQGKNAVGGFIRGAGSIGASADVGCVQEPAMKRLQVATMRPRCWRAFRALRLRLQAFLTPSAHPA